MYEPSHSEREREREREKDIQTHTYIHVYIYIYRRLYEIWGCRGLEKALDQIEAERGESTEAAIQLERQAQGLARSDSAEKERDVRRVVMREKRQAAWRHLSLTERDMLTVLSAVCKVAPPASPQS